MCVLVVEDEQNVREVARRILERVGYTVITADDGEEGLSAFKSNAEEIDLVISDLCMPRMNGLSMISSILSVKPDVKVVLTSGANSRENMPNIGEWSRRHPEILFVPKPYTLPELAAAVERVLGCRRSPADSVTSLVTR